MWEVTSVVADRFRYIYKFGNGLEPLLASILQQGPHSADGPLYFWMATFIASLGNMWGAIYDSKMLITNAIGVDSPRSSSIKLSLEHFRKDPYRVGQSEVHEINPDADSGNTTISSLPTLQSAYGEMSNIQHGSLEELWLALAEILLGELEKFGDDHIFQDLGKAANIFGMHSIVCSAAE
jgi:hypothetical protein